MKFKKSLILCIFLLIIIFIYFYQTKKVTSLPFDTKNSSFLINQEIVTLKKGLAKTDTTTTKYFGNEAMGDLNGDKIDDIAYLVTQETGGSGTFYYAVVSLSSPTGYRNTNAFFIGDRIAPQNNTINSSAKELYINFAERKKGEPMTTQPSSGAVTILRVTQDGILQGLMK